MIIKPSILKIYAGLNLILSWISLYFLVKMVIEFMDDSLWGAYLDLLAGLAVKDIFFWLTAFIALSLQTIYLYFWISNSDCQKKYYSKIPPLIGNLALAFFICYYGLKGLIMEVSFSKTLWQLRSLWSVADSALVLSIPLANIALMLRLSRKEKNGYSRTDEYLA